MKNKKSLIIMTTVSSIFAGKSCKSEDKELKILKDMIKDEGNNEKVKSLDDLLMTYLGNNEEASSESVAKLIKDIEDKSKNLKGTGKIEKTFYLNNNNELKSDNEIKTAETMAKGKKFITINCGGDGQDLEIDCLVGELSA